MTCKDCLHYEACESMLRAIGCPFDGECADADERCDTFADRSRYVVREKGEWDDSGRYKFADGSKAIRCPFCGACINEEEYDLYVWNFCPYCGSDMRGEQ